ncbi:MAG: hypothetical protein EPO40_11400 [Myxococcaceae bacterium]|nr:MAG: hypothetical protein EPO40_11400 [Myxococcaceae bacterium]
MTPLRALGPALALLLLGACSSPTPVSDASVDLGADLGVDTATPAVMDASDDRFDSGVAALREGEIPRTFRDETLPEFRVDLGAADLASLLVEGSTARVPMTLRYLGGAYRGTIRQRLGNNSRCGALRQFRIDFPAPITFPDGYRTDRFETDRGRCYVLHEWLSVSVMRRVAEMHPELRLPFKYTNVVAIYFNDALYHVETLTEDVGRDLGQRIEGTRNVSFYENGCYLAETTGFIGEFCRTFDRARLSSMLDIPVYLQWSATVMALAPGDNYPDRPYNWVLMRNDDTGVARPLGDDWDEVPALEPDAQADPFTPAHPSGDLQRHFTSLLTEPDLRERYVAALGDARRAMDPAVTLPRLAMKYAQVRALLGRVPGLPLTLEQYDNLYDVHGEVPRFFRERYDFLGGATGLGDAGVTR